LPELPDLTVCLESLAARIANQRLLRVRLLNPFLLRTAVPPIAAVEDKRVGQAHYACPLRVRKWDARLHRGRNQAPRLAAPGAGQERLDAIVYAENETNYCARCQTGGRILADRVLSRLLKKSWPRSIEELE